MLNVMYISRVSLYFHKSVLFATDCMFFNFLLIVQYIIHVSILLTADVKMSLATCNSM
jgi:hypothetical protein